MARVGWTSGETQEEAEASVEAERHQVRIVSCREIDLSGLPPLASGPLPRHWVFKVEDLTPELAAERPQHEDDSEEAMERWVRRFYLKMDTNPELLSSGTIEMFPCPNCEDEVRIELPPSREKPHPGNFSCPHCRAHLQLAKSGRWEVAPPSQRRDDHCIFCGQKANSYEHIVPEWISNRLGIKAVISMEGSIQIGPEPRRRPISFASYRARIFCKGCNAHFKHLEDAVIPVIVPMARGQVFSFGGGERELVARWCLKTAIALLSAEPGDQDAVPLAHRRALRENGDIVASSWIGIFRWKGEPVITSGDGLVTAESRPGQHREAYSVMLAFEGFGFYVTAYNDSPEAPVPYSRDHPPMLCVWPRQLGLTHWPPPPTDNRTLPAKLFTGWTPLQHG
jgi:hypothetical protein